MFFVEAGFFSHRALWMLIFAGVFERYPNLKLILTEGGADWVPGVMKILDHQYNKISPNHRTGFGSATVYAQVDISSLTTLYVGWVPHTVGLALSAATLMAWVGLCALSRRERIACDK